MYRQGRWSETNIYYVDKKIKELMLRNSVELRKESVWNYLSRSKSYIGLRPVKNSGERVGVEGLGPVRVRKNTRSV